MLTYNDFIEHGPYADMHRFWEGGPRPVTEGPRQQFPTDDGQPILSTEETQSEMERGHLIDQHEQLEGEYLPQTVRDELDALEADEARWY